MICPHCDRYQRRRERLGHRCGSCRRDFVFEPHDHGSRLNDRRVKRAAAWLSDNGRFRFTWAHLVAVLAHGRGLPPDFRETMLRRWPEAHGSMPAGLIDVQETPAARGPADDAAAHVLCTDPDIRHCLSANDAERIFGVFVAGPDDLPDGPQPVLMLDDFAATDARVVGASEAHRRLAALRHGGRRVLALGPATASPRLIEVRPAILLDWLDLTVRAEARFRAGARRASEVDFLDWPAPPT